MSRRRMSTGRFAFTTLSAGLLFGVVATIAIAWTAVWLETWKRADPAVVARLEIEAMQGRVDAGPELAHLAHDLGEGDQAGTDQALREGSDAQLSSWRERHRTLCHYFDQSQRLSAQ